MIIVMMLVVVVVLIVVDVVVVMIVGDVLCDIVVVDSYGVDVDVVLYVHCDVINDVGYDNGDAMCCVDCVEVVVVDCVIVVGLCC